MDIREKTWEALSFLSDLEYDAQGSLIEALQALVVDTDSQELVVIVNAYVDAVNTWNRVKNDMIDRI